MAIILFRCPYCSKKVETSEDNVGREGLCPGCQKIFEIPEPAKKDAARAVRTSGGIGLGVADAPEYGDLAVLLGVGAVALGAAGVLAATFLPWLQAWAHAGDLMAAQKSLLIAGSGVCLAFLLVSALARKSLMAPALTGAAWGMFALVWAASIARAVGKASPPATTPPWPSASTSPSAPARSPCWAPCSSTTRCARAACWRSSACSWWSPRSWCWWARSRWSRTASSPRLPRSRPSRRDAAQQPAKIAPAPATRPRGRR